MPPIDRDLMPNQLWFLATYEFRSGDPIVPRILELLSRKAMPGLDQFPETIPTGIKLLREKIAKSKRGILLNGERLADRVEYVKPTGGSGGVVKLTNENEAVKMREKEI